MVVGCTITTLRDRGEWVVAGGVRDQAWSRRGGRVSLIPCGRFVLFFALGEEDFSKEALTDAVTVSGASMEF